MKRSFVVQVEQIFEFPLNIPEMVALDIAYLPLPQMHLMALHQNPFYLPLEFSRQNFSGSLPPLWRFQPLLHPLDPLALSHQYFPHFQHLPRQFQLLLVHVLVDVLLLLSEGTLDDLGDPSADLFELVVKHAGHFGVEGLYFEVDAGDFGGDAG